MSDLVNALVAQSKGWPDTPDYDMNAFMRAYTSLDPQARTAVNVNDGLPHFPDTYKLPTHPSFSDESQYAVGPGYGHWYGGALPNGGESWQLRRPNGEVLVSEAPWLQHGIAVSPQRQRQLGGPSTDDIINDILRQY